MLLQMVRFSLFLWLSDSPLYICSNDGHLGCFHILAIVNNAAMSIAVHLFFQIGVLGNSNIYPEVEPLSDKAVPFLIF